MANSLQSVTVIRLADTWRIHGGFMEDYKCHYSVELILRKIDPFHHKEDLFPLSESPFPIGWFTRGHNPLKWLDLSAGCFG